MDDKGKPSKSATALAEEQVLERWQRDNTFQKSVDQRQQAPYFAFNDGPPFANGLPHFGHSLVTAVKDSILRYKTMRGLHVPRRNGWDCHGLPVEFSIEKEFGVSGKKQILELGLEKFNAACRESIFRYKADWEEFMTRIGRWSDYENYYATVDTSYTESVWWILSEINKKGLLYRGLKSVPYCPRCETPLSNFELNEGYKDNVPDPSVFVKFKLREGERIFEGSEFDTKTPVENRPAIKSAYVELTNHYLLAWTTTPWTLPANAALAIEPDTEYAFVELIDDGSTLILAKERLDVLDLRKKEYSLTRKVLGSKLVGLRYEPLYSLPEGKFTDEQAKNAHQVFADNSVSVDDGTGILHVAPRYGETDLNLGLAQNLPLIESVDASGHLIYGPKEALNLFFKEADRHIIADLTHKNKIFAAETAEHTYPFCWRCETPLMYFATTTWFVEVTKVKDQMIKAAEDINWVPSHIKSGRFGKWLEGARDWAISRNRYWGAPMPIWQNVDDENDYILVGSIAELEELAGKETVQKALPKVEGKDELDLHRPFIDKVSFQKDGKTYKRVEEVLDCWFESGSMPVAQWHYPFENKELFDKTFPADFITEAIDQTRLWFYVQHVISTILFERPAYKQVIVTGFMMAADGQKLSKRLRNYPPVEEVFDHEGADALRLYLLSKTQGTETADYMRFDRSAMTDMKRNVLDTLSNSFRFFKTYADVDGWKPKGSEETTSDNVLDQWILARLSETVAAATKSADAYKISHAILPVFELIDDLSNWYIRRSRRRFWKSENDKDKEQAYATLHYVLTRICQLLAPWAPFIAEEIWQNLRQGTNLEESVHLSDWPSVKEPDSTSQKVLGEMQLLRIIVADGLSKRAEKKIKVRQPLSKLTFNSPSSFNDQMVDILKDELNVKEVVETRPRVESIWEGGSARIVPSTTLDINLTDELKQEGIMREVVRSVQNARKKAGLNVEDRIQLKIESDSAEITEAIKKFKDTIFAETLASDELTGEGSYSESVKVEDQQATISLRKA
ncbi:MAG TPA: isoleucine--tRNA ligase [Candidatus Saccharimonadales bacterium]|nr:isoleucine--tRNA ligase [Candidatus Saccharimonadales bacterium]